MNVFPYVRVSGKTQLDGDGPERQRGAIAAFAKTHGLNISNHWEEAISGTLDGMNRPGFQAMLAEIDARKDIGAVVVERMDRLARDLMVGEVMMAELRRRNVQLFATDQGALVDMAADGADATRVLIRQIMGALAQWEKANLVKKLSAAKARIRASGKRCDGQKPFGKNTTEKNILQLVRSLSESGELTATGIARLLNEGGFKTRTGALWSRQSIEHIQKIVTKG
jgi:DNA invertase Pin-like site-specific DNA recombinase